MFRPNLPERRFPWRWAAAVLLVALGLRLGWGLTRATDLSDLPDQAEYLALGRSLLGEGRLAFEDPRFADTVRAFRMPGYPVLVAACGGSVTVVRAVQSLVDTSAVLAVMLLAHRLTLGRLGVVVAGGFVALSPLNVYFAALLLTETLFTAMLAWSMLLLATPAGKRGWWAGLALIAVSVLVRPSGILLPAVLAGGSVFLHRRHPFTADRRLIAGPVTVGLLAVAVCLLPWTLRNWIVVGSPVPTTTNTGLTLYDGLNPEADGSSDQSVLLHLPQLRRMDEVQRSNYLRGRAVDFAAEHPGRVVELAVAKVRRTWSPVPLSAQFGSTRNAVIAAAHALPLFGLAVAGVLASVVSREPRRRVVAFLLLPAVYFTLVHALTVGSLRYRVPAEAPLAVVAAAGVVAIRRAAAAD